MALVAAGLADHRNGTTKLYKEKTDGIKWETLEKLCKTLKCEISDFIEIVDGDKDVK